MDGPYCRVCGGNCPDSGCKKAGFQWALDDCMLTARLDGADIKPLDLCDWLYCHMPDVTMALRPQGPDSHIELRRNWSCGSQSAGEDKIYICDMLGLASVDCLGDICTKNAKPCDMLVFDPCCGKDPCIECDGCDPTSQWKPYSIPRADSCCNEQNWIDPDACGGYKVLALNDCHEGEESGGCIVEKCLLPSDQIKQWIIRDTYPNDPDYLFTVGNYEETIPLDIATNCPEWYGKYDIEINISYGFQVIHPTGEPTTFCASMLTVHYSIGVVDPFIGTVTISGVNPFPWGTTEGNASREFIARKGYDVSLQNIVQMRSTASYPGLYHPANEGTKSDAPLQTASRLHGLVVTAKPVRRIE